jgi:hypothetical protein
MLVAVGGSRGFAGAAGQSTTDDKLLFLGRPSWRSASWSWPSAPPDANANSSRNRPCAPRETPNSWRRSLAIVSSRCALGPVVEGRRAGLGPGASRPPGPRPPSMPAGRRNLALSGVRRRLRTVHVRPLGVERHGTRATAAASMQRSVIGSRLRRTHACRHASTAQRARIPSRDMPAWR